MPLHSFAGADLELTGGVDQPPCLRLRGGIAGQICIHQVGMFLQQPHEKLLQFLGAEKLLRQARDQQHIVVGSTQQFGFRV
jgi:hypothetical protein